MNAEQRLWSLRVIWLAALCGLGAVVVQEGARCISGQPLHTAQSAVRDYIDRVGSTLVVGTWLIDVAHAVHDSKDIPEFPICLLRASNSQSAVPASYCPAFEHSRRCPRCAPGTRRVYPNTPIGCLSWSWAVPAHYSRLSDEYTCKPVQLVCPAPTSYWTRPFCPVL